MKIESSQVLMSGQSSSLVVQTKDESLRLWTGNRGPDPGGQNIPLPLDQFSKDKIEISPEGLEASKMHANGLSSAEDDGYVSIELSEKDKQKIELIRQLLERLTGKKVKFVYLDKIKVKNSPGPAAENSPQRTRQGWGLEYNFSSTYHESQKMSFTSQGTVKTADGREINFSVNLSMSREFMSSQNISIRAGDALMKDPLVINFDGGAPQLSGEKMYFDIDSDGTADQISRLASGSGFLALDLNKDGIINNGSELFGTLSGDGFKDLMAYDSDGNNWIDENDPIFEGLRIWSVDSEGNYQLAGLGEKGIGAIYLGNVSTAFDLKNSSNELEGAVRRTGIFLRENRTAGTIQHIDLAV